MVSGITVVNIAAHDPFEAVAQPTTFYLFEPGADGPPPMTLLMPGAARRRPRMARFLVLHKSMITESHAVSATIRRRLVSCSAR